MEKKKDDKVNFGLTLEGELFEELERARQTERGRIPRNEFIKTAIVKLISQTNEVQGL